MPPFADGRTAPPADLPGNPVTVLLPAGTVLWRVHASGFGATQFKPVAPKSSYEGGRFDALHDGDPYLYAGDSAECAIAELWDRDIGPGPSERFISEATLDGRALSRIQSTVDLTLIDVSVPASSQFGQTAWFTTCDPYDYPHTRDWADWLRKKAPSHSGFRWRSRRDMDRYSYVLFEHQLPPGIPVFQAIDSVPVHHGAGRILVEQTMLAHNAVFRM